MVKNHIAPLKPPFCMETALIIGYHAASVWADNMRMHDGCILLSLLISAG